MPIYVPPQSLRRKTVTLMTPQGSYVSVLPPQGIRVKIVDSTPVIVAETVLQSMF